MEHSWGVIRASDQLLWARCQSGGSSPSFEYGEIALQGGNVALHATPRHTALGISATEIALRTTQLPFTRREQIRQVLPQEAEESLIGKKQQPHFAFIQTEHGEDGASILYAVAERSQLQQQIDDAEKAGVRGYSYPVSETGSWLLLKDVGLISDDENSLIIDCSTTPAALLSIEQGSLKNVRVVSPAACQRGGEAVAEELQWLLKNQLQQNAAVDCLVLLNCGDEVIESQAPLQIEQIERRIAPQLTDLGMGMGMESWAFIRPAGLALAMRPSLKGEGQQQLDFRSGALAGEINWKEWLYPWRATAAVLLLLVLTGLVQEGARYAMLQQQSEVVASDIRSLFQTTLPNVPMVDPLAQIQQAYQKITGSEEKPTRRLGQWMALVQTTVPSETQVKWKQLQYEEGQLQLVGEVPSYDHLDRVQSALRAVEGVDEVMMEKAQILTKSRHVQFNLKVM